MNDTTIEQERREWYEEQACRSKLCLCMDRRDDHAAASRKLGSPEYDGACTVPGCRCHRFVLGESA